MIRAISIPVDREYPIERATMRALFALFGISVLLYGWFVALSVFNVIARKEALAGTVRVSASVAVLDAEYFALSGGVTAERGAELGLSERPSATFVYRPGAVGSAASRNEI